MMAILDIGHLAYADNLVLLGSTQFELQQALDRFGAVCCNAGMKISASKSEVLVVSRRHVRCDIHINGEPFRQVKKVKYLGVYFTSDGRPDTEISLRVGQAGSGLGKIELSREAKLSVFRAVFVPIFT